MKSGSVKLLSRRIIGRNARRFRNDTPDGKERHAAVWRTEIYSTLPNAPCGMIRAFPKRYSKQRRAACGGVENGNILDASERSVRDDPCVSETIQQAAKSGMRRCGERKYTRRFRTLRAG